LFSLIFIFLDGSGISTTIVPTDQSGVPDFFIDKQGSSTNLIPEDAQSGVSVHAQPGASDDPHLGSSVEAQHGLSVDLQQAPLGEPQPGSSNDPEPGPSGIRPAGKKNESGQEVETEAGVTVEGNSWLQYSDLMSDSYPAKSKFVYLKAYKQLEKFLKSRNQWEPNTCPTDLQVLNYFYHLRHDLKFAPTTLWSLYARINAVMKRLYGVSLNSYTRVGDVLKSYDSGHVVKKAGVFTPQQIEDFVSDPQLNSKYWLVRKVVCLVGYYGGFRNKELKSLKFENCELDSMGYWFTFQRAKQRGRLEETSICIPRRQPDWVPVVSDSSRVGLDFDPASLIDLYLAEVQADLLCSVEELKGDFFRATHGMKGQKFTRLSLGKNTIGRVGVQVATELCLARPEMYTGHCWRRSCGTSASDSGVNVTTLMAMMGWSNPKTAMVYVKKSRLTSLSLSLYLTNVQRQNCRNPFPNCPIEKRQSNHQSKVPSPVVAKCSNTLVSSCNGAVSSGPSNSDLKVEELDGSPGEENCSQGSVESDIDFDAPCGEVDELDCAEDSLALEESEVRRKKESSSSRVPCNGGDGEGAVVNVHSSGPVSQFANLDPRVAGILQNMNNTGNITINFHFDSCKK
jgi:hypothetical protein